MRNVKDRERQLAIAQGAKRLIDPTGMGREYTVLGVVGDGKGASKDQQELESSGEVWPFVDSVREESKKAPS
jgi:NADH dehydrogenase [ubiquinone] 1 alpha subcomplex assembly factor 7